MAAEGKQQQHTREPTLPALPVALTLCCLHACPPCRMQVRLCVRLVLASLMWLLCVHLAHACSHMCAWHVVER
jgi:hypothetical protein